MELQLPEGGPAGESGVGAAFVWGENSSGQLLLPTFESQRLPAKVPGLSSMAELSCGSFHSIAVTAMGELLSGGLNTEGQTGTGKHEPDTPREPVASTEDEEATEFVPPAPRPIEALMTKKCVQVACGYAHSVALTADHAVFGWGSNNIGQCGQADCERVLRPRRVDLPAPAACLAAGASHTLVVTQGAALYSFGTNYHGECGRGTTISPCPPGRVELGGTLAMDCAAGESHSAVLGTSGAVLTFGDTRKGACGASKDGHSPQLLPAQIVSFRNSRDGPYLDGVRPPIVDVSCSATATIMADKDGSVYCCGELAGSAFTVATKLRGFVPDGATIHELAAGEQHVLAVCSGEIGAEVFGTGDNTAGQLGTADGSSKVQLPVLGPHETYHISAAGAQSACVVIPTDNESAPRIWRAQLQESLQAVRFLGNPDARPAAVVSVEAVFSSSALLVAAFASSEHDFCSVDVGQLESTYKALLIQGKKDPSLLSTLLSASRRCIQDGLVAPEAAAQTDMLQNILYPCLIIMQNPLSWTGSAELALQCIRIVVRQAQSSEADAGSFQDAIRNCYRSNRQLLGARLVLPLHQLLERRLKSQNTVDANSIAAIGLLTVLHSASEAEARATGAPLVPAERWYNSYISAHWPIEQDYAAWRQGGGFAEGGFSICATPYLLDVAAKQRVLRVENDITTRQAVHSSHMRAYFQQGLRGTEVASEFLFRKPRRGGAGPPSHPQYRRDLATHPTYLVLQVRRDHLLEDLMEELAPRTREALTQPLKVIFLGEEGVDEGGLRKELFQLVTEQMFQPAFGLWVHDDATRTWWFQSDGPNSDEEQNVEYFLIGLVIGLAIHNGVILDLSFPRLVWSKLLGNEVGLSDLTDAFPETGAGLHRLLEWNSELDGGSIADVFCLDFTATVQHLDTTHTVELCPGGADIDVTEENRADYAASFAKWRMHDSVAQAFGSFRRGFLLLCDGLHLGLFSATELEELVCGSRHLDFAELQAYTRYEGFTEHSPTVVHFWEVAHELSTEEKKLLLTFATGTDRAPLGGLKNLEPKFAIQRAGPDSMLLPTSHTCFNVLCLPEYKTRAKLRSLLHTAIHNAAGFGFA